MQYHSKPREVILEVLKNTTSHPTAEWVYSQAKKTLPRLSLGTVYRNLRLLAEKGEILELDLGTSLSRYDGYTGEHGHFTCHICGRVMDLDVTLPENFYEMALGGKDLEITGHNLSFSGLCSECRKKKNK